MTGVAESAEFICNNATYVKLGPEENFKKAAEILEPLVNAYKPENWAESNLHPAHFDPKQKASWIFLTDTLNFAFWAEQGQPLFTVKYNDKLYTGYLSLVAAIRRAVDQGKPILDPKFWSNCTTEDIRDIFHSETTTEIPLLDYRLEVLHEAGNFVIKNFTGSTYEMIKSTNNSAVNLVNLVSANLKSYCDKYIYKGKQVSFLKRAQILAADLHFAFLADNDPVCHFNDIDRLTMFADYRVPQALNYFGLIIYRDDLMTKLREEPHLEPGCEMECEIRGCSIHSVEKLKAFMKEKHPSILIDFILWDYAKANSQQMDHIPIHKTRSVFY